MEGVNEGQAPALPIVSPFAENAKEAFQPWSGSETPGGSEPASRAGSMSPAPAQQPPEIASTMARQTSIKASLRANRQPQLWRQSSAVTDRAASLGYTGVAALCGDTFLPPNRLKKIRKLGEGAYAVVDEAQLLPAPEGSDNWPSTASRTGPPEAVAVKRLKPNVLESEDDVMAFIKEARLLLRLRHPSIIEYKGLGCDDNSSSEAEWRTMYLVQEYATDGTLKNLIFSQMINPRKKLYTLGEAVSWACQVAEGLAFMHRQNPMVLHRDLKAENVLLTRNKDGTLCARLADLGLHKLVPRLLKATKSFADIKEEGSHHGASNAALLLNGRPSAGTTDQAGMLGKISMHDKRYELTGQTGAYVYMAPEVFMGAPYNEKVDVFSFGVILYELLHRTMIVAELMRLGSEEAAQEYAHMVAAGHREPISGDLPAALALLVKDCLAGLPELRPSMAEVVQRLEKVRASGELEAVEQRFGPAAQTGCCTIM